MPEPTGGFGSGIVYLIAALSIPLATIIVATVNKTGSKRSQDDQRYAGIIDQVQVQNAALWEENRKLRDELAACENLRRKDFDDAVRRYFPECADPKELGSGDADE